MFRFEDPIYLYLLALIPILALIRFVSYRNQRKRLRRFGEPALLKALMPDVSRFRPGVKYAASDKVTFVASLGGLGFQQSKLGDYKDTNVGFNVDGNALKFGVYYAF